MTLGLDYCDAAVRAVIVNDGGQVLARADQATAGGSAQAAREAIRRARNAAGTSIDAAGIASSSMTGNVPMELTPVLSEALPGVTPVGIGAGAAAAVAEAWCGAARGLQNVITFSIGEHVTAGIVLRGEVWGGAHGLAGSVGWLALNPVERDDYRRFGGLEAEVASAGIVRRLVWRVKAGDRSSIVEQIDGDLSRLTADHVFQGARAGDGVSIAVVRDTARYVGMAIANLASVLDPDAIVLGGTLAGSGDMMLEAIRVECGRRLSPGQAERLKIVLSSLGADAVAVGAARAAALKSA